LRFSGVADGGDSEAGVVDADVDVADGAGVGDGDSDDVGLGERRRFLPVIFEDAFSRRRSDRARDLDVFLGAVSWFTSAANCGVNRGMRFMQRFRRQLLQISSPRRATLRIK